MNNDSNTGTASVPNAWLAVDHGLGACINWANSLCGRPICSCTTFTSGVVTLVRRVFQTLHQLIIQCLSILIAPSQTRAAGQFLGRSDCPFFHFG